MKKKTRMKIKLKKGYKRLLILICTFLALMEVFYMYTRYRMHVDKVTEDAETYGESIASNIKLNVDNCISKSVVLKNMYLEFGDEFLKDFDKICSRIAEGDSMISSMYFAPNAVIQYAYPREINEATIGFEMLKDSEQAEWAERAIATKRVTIAGPHELVEGGTGLIIRNPIFVNDEFVGFTIVVLDWDKFKNGILRDIKVNKNGYNFAVWKENDAHAVVDSYGFIINNGDQNVSKKVDVKINIPNDVWHLSVEPTDGWNLIQGVIPEYCISLVLTILVIYMVYLRFRKTSEILDYVQHDELTGIFTKQYFYHRAKEIIGKNPNTSYELVIADVENFKMINSIHGEAKGDKVLQYLAGIFLGKLDEGEICGRIGGDQFAFLVYSKRERDRRWLEDIVEDINKNSPVQNLVVKFGIYEDVDHNLTVAAMTDRALLAVKSIKRNYDKLYANYDGPVSKEHLKIQTFETNFEMALKNEEFVVWYQPKYDAASEKIVGAEALVRWITRDGTFISPGEFIPAFEEDGLIIKLDEYVFRKVCQSIRAWMDRGSKILPISVNLSRASLFHEGTVEKYKKIVAEYGVPTEYVPIELTESAAVHSVQIKELTKELKEAGFQLHMDDFGSGVSSLASFNTLPFDVVKLDKSMVDFIGDASGDELLKYTIALAHFKQMKVVAEGVETKEQLDFLKTLACDVIQGYYFSKPRPYEDFSEYLEKMWESEVDV